MSVCARVNVGWTVTSGKSQINSFKSAFVPMDQQPNETESYIQIRATDIEVIGFYDHLKLNENSTLGLDKLLRIKSVVLTLASALMCSRSRGC